MKNEKYEVSLANYKIAYDKERLTIEKAALCLLSFIGQIEEDNLIMTLNNDNLVIDWINEYSLVEVESVKKFNIASKLISDFDVCRFAMHYFSLKQKVKLTFTDNRTKNLLTIDFNQFEKLDNSIFNLGELKKLPFYEKEKKFKFALEFKNNGEELKYNLNLYREFLVFLNKYSKNNYIYKINNNLIEYNGQFFSVKEKLCNSLVTLFEKPSHLKNTKIICFFNERFYYFKFSNDRNYTFIEDKVIVISMIASPELIKTSRDIENELKKILEYVASFSYKMNHTAFVKDVKTLQKNIDDEKEINEIKKINQNNFSENLNYWLALRKKIIFLIETIRLFKKQYPVGNNSRMIFFIRLIDYFKNLSKEIYNLLNIKYVIKFPISFCAILRSLIQIIMYIKFQVFSIPDDKIENNPDIESENIFIPSIKQFFENENSKIKQFGLDENEVFNWKQKNSETMENFLNLKNCDFETLKQNFISFEQKLNNSIHRGQLPKYIKEKKDRYLDKEWFRCDLNKFFENFTIEMKEYFLLNPLF